MCLICNKVLSNEAWRPSRLLDHLNRMHPDKKDKKEEFFRNLRDKLQKKSQYIPILHFNKISSIMDCFALIKYQD